MARKKSKGLERQDAFIKSIENQPFDFGLVFTQAFLKGIRDIGYKGTHTALFESIDNSIQAESSNIHLVFDWNSGKANKEPDRIAIIDDGHGMSEKMIRVAVLWGGSDRLDDRKGMGKYGYGLPSSCVSIGQRFTVISKRDDMNEWHAVTIDIDEIAKRSPEYIDQNTQRVVAPAARAVEIPQFVSAYLKNSNIDLNSGTIVLIDKIDRLSYKRFADLKDFLIRETGVYYRNFLRAVNIKIDGVAVEPIDPLFITEGFRYYNEDDDRATALTPQSIPFKDLGAIKVRYSYMPPTFLRKPEAKHKNAAGSRKDMNERFKIRKENNGIIVNRAGREINVGNSKCPWTVFINNDRYIAVELDFPPTMDEYFSITTSKQQVGMHESLWDALESAGVREAIEGLRGDYKKALRDFKAKLQINSSKPGEQRPSVPEQVMQESSESVDVNPDSVPPHVKNEGEEELNKTAKKKSEESGVDEDSIKKALKAETELRPYAIDFIDEEEGPFFRPKQVGGQVKIFINKAHRFYSDMYENPQATPHLKNALALLLFSIGLSELRVTEDRKKMYQIERHSWSIKLQTVLEKLSEHSEDSEDEREMDEEIQFSAAENENTDSR